MVYFKKTLWSTWMHFTKVSKCIKQSWHDYRKQIDGDADKLQYPPFRKTTMNSTENQYWVAHLGKSSTRQEKNNLLKPHAEVSSVVMSGQVRKARWCKPFTPALERLRLKDCLIGDQPELRSKTLLQKTTIQGYRCWPDSSLALQYWPGYSQLTCQWTGLLPARKSLLDPQLLEVPSHQYGDIPSYTRAQKHGQLFPWSS